MNFLKNQLFNLTEQKRLDDRLVNRDWLPVGLS